jgi:hypothetical protein
MLPMVARSEKDFAGNDLVGDTDTRTEIHHIYPLRWCRENAAGEWRAMLSIDGEGPNYVNSIANLMPLSRALNAEWSAKSPATFFADRGIEYEGPVGESLKRVFIDEEAFRMLRGGFGSIEEFWLHRANLIANHLIDLTKV